MMYFGVTLTVLGIISISLGISRLFSFLFMLIAISIVYFGYSQLRKSKRKMEKQLLKRSDGYVYTGQQKIKLKSKKRI